MAQATRNNIVRNGNLVFRTFGGKKAFPNQAEKTLGEPLLVFLNERYGDTPALEKGRKTNYSSLANAYSNSSVWLYDMTAERTLKTSIGRVIVIKALDKLVRAQNEDGSYKLQPGTDFIKLVDTDTGDATFVFHMKWIRCIWIQFVEQIVRSKVQRDGVLAWAVNAVNRIEVSAEEQRVVKPVEVVEEPEEPSEDDSDEAHIE